MRSKNSDQIAIVGIGCRFPGGIVSPATFWELLCRGEDATGEVPPDRWDLCLHHDANRERPDAIYTRRGGFIREPDIRTFDPAFFGISPREAAAMDPQQRLLLETAWEAFEDASLRPDDWTGKAVGVFVGLFTHDFEAMRMRRSEMGLISAHSATGMSTTIAANRVSHAFGFAGPSMVIDTACSSSLVAVHQACRSLRSGESKLALAGGVNLQLLPEMVAGLCKAQMMAADGRCKSFDASGDGYARADGAGLLLLRPLADALAAGDPIHAVIHGTAVNQDGRTPGITVPSGAAQKAVIRAALADAGVEAADIGYVEAHGTGTPVGDPIEARALGEVLRADAPEAPDLVVGSVKSNFGHTEGAAGVAGLIKLALAVQHGRIPANLHFRTPNPDIPFEALRLRVPTAMQDWPATGRRLGGVNSFGFGGTNAHAVVGEPPRPRRHRRARPALPGGNSLICLSARSEAALKAAVRDHLAWLRDNPRVPLPEVAAALAAGRTHHPHRLALAARDRAAVQAGLSAHLEGRRHPGMVAGTAGTGSGKTAFVFSGMGQQWWAMGRALLDTSPVFAETLARIDALFAGHTRAWSLLAELRADRESSRIDRTEIAQPAIFAVQAGLTALWRSLGVVPDVVVGHSVGEIAAAHASGALSLEQAVAVCYHRSRLQARLAGAGRMLALGLPEAEAAERLAAFTRDVCIAAVNSPSSVTLAGDEAALKQLEALFSAEGVFARLLNVEVPYHSPAMEAIGPDLHTALAPIRGGETAVPLVSTVTGAPIEGTRIDAAYWFRNVREPVAFARAMASLLERGCTRFVEIGAHPVLANSIRECAAESGTEVVIAASLRRDADATEAFLEALGTLHVRNAGFDVAALHDRPARRLDLPRYPWQRQHFWSETDLSLQDRTGRTPDGGMVHPLLGGQLGEAVTAWRSIVGPGRPGYLQDHRIRGAVLFPAAGFLEAALAATRSPELSAQINAQAVAVSDLRILRPLVLDPAQRTQLSTVTDGAGGIAILSSAGDSLIRPWLRHATCRATAEPARLETAPRALAAMRARMRPVGPIADLYARLALRGLEYGPRFRNITEAWQGRGEALGRIALQPADLADAGRYRLHPALLDSAFHLMALLPGEGTYLPVGCRRLDLVADVGTAAWAHVRLNAADETRLSGDLELLDDGGALLARLEGLSFRRAEDLSAATGGGSQGRYYDRIWTEIPAAGLTGGQAIAPRLPEPAALAEALDAAGPAPRPEADPRRTALPALEGLALAILTETLGALGCPWNGAPATERDLAAAMGIAPRHHRWLRLMLDHLARSGHASLRGRHWQIGGAPGVAAADALFRALIEAHPDCHAELSALRRAADHLPAILRGEEEPREGLFAAGFPFDHLASDSPFARPGNRALAALVERLLADLPSSATLRIAQIGGGSGAVLSWLVPYLPEGRCRFTFTDPDAEAVERARERFAAWPHLEFAVLDPERDPADQGFAAGGFDLVIAADALCRTTSLAEALDRTRAILAPGGLLAVLETTEPALWEDLVLGLHPGRWLFSDTALRAERATLSAAEWQALLRTRFDQVAIALDHGDDEGPAARPLFLARQGMPAPTGEAAPLAPPPAPEPILILGPRDATSLALAAALEGLGLDARHLPAEAIGDGRLAAWLAASAVRPKVVDLTALAVARAGDPVAAGDGACLRLRDLAQVLGDEGGALWIVTRDAQRIAGEGGDGLAGAPVWGFARALGNELRALSLRLADLGAAADEAEIAQLARLIAEPDPEDEVALRGRRRFASRIAPLRPLRRADGRDGPFTSARQRRKPPADIGFRGRRTGPAGPGEVRLRLMAMGVNYKDFAIIAGLLDHADNVDTTRIGIEGAGIVEAVGPGVTGLKPGDRVFGGISRLEQPAAAPEWSLARIPDNLSFEEAAGITATFATGWHGLRHLARVEEGETVLIHSAASGLGLATIQIARHLGARVLVTAGSEDKRRFLAALGVEVIGSSRNAGFVEAALKATGGRGVDVIFSSLPVSLVPANLKALRPGTGRLIDVVNINHDTRLDFRDIATGATVSGFDLNTLSVANPEHFNRLLREVAELMGERALRPTPYRAVPVSRASEIVNSLRRGSHIGKNVIRLDEGLIEMLPPPGRLALDPGASYLVTGGLGGLGLALARALIDSGARHLVLAGRRGAATPGAGAALAELEERGARVEAVACDMADARQVEALVARFGSDWPRLDGILHAAGLVRDGFVRDMSDAALTAVTGAKAAGAWHLHRATKAMALGFFVAFSSITDLFGNPAQANYGAANAFVEALMRWRRAQGLPGLAMAPGAIKAVGIAARDEALQAALARRGIGEIGTAEIWDDLCWALAEGRAYLADAPMNWEVFGPGLPAFGRAGRFVLLAAGLPQDAGAEAAGAPGAGATREERLAWLSTVVPRAVASILGISEERLDRDRPLPDLGFDSLMSAELVVEIERKTGVRLRQGTLMRADLSTEALILETEKLIARPGAEGGATEPSPARADTLPAGGVNVDALSDSEVEALLSRLEEKESGDA